MAVENRGEIGPIAINSEVLEKVIRRIVEVAQPDKIILFGSAVRGEIGSNSDLDLLVVKSGVHRRHLAQAIYQNLIKRLVPIIIQHYTNVRVKVVKKV